MNKKVAMYVTVGETTRKRAQQLAHFHGYVTLSEVVSQAVDLLYKQVVTRRSGPPSETEPDAQEELE